VPRLARALVGWLAFVTLALAVVGVVSVVSHGVRARQSELSVRMVLGATPGRLRLDLLAEVVPVLASGLLLGALAGVSAGFGARALLHDTSPLDGIALVSAAMVLVAAAAVATWLPTRTVTRLDPARVIRDA
jgi:ABC-type antimicrobial peptide transport system permease subunit